MIKFTIGTIIPENEGWVWSSETIGEPVPRNVFLKLAGVNGVIDMSRVAAGKLLYDGRDISVTFARFRRGADRWLETIQTLTDEITQLFSQNNEITITTKTNPDVGYTAYAWNWKPSRDGIIQFLTLTFKVKPVNLLAFSEYVTIAHEELELSSSWADNTTQKITIREVHVYQGTTEYDSKVVTVYDDDDNVVYSGLPSDFQTTPWEIDMSVDEVQTFRISVADLAGWSVNFRWTKEVL